MQTQGKPRLTMDPTQGPQANNTRPNTPISTSPRAAWRQQLWIPVLLSVLLIGVNQTNFLLFHTLAEFFAIFVAVLISVVAWHTYQFSRNRFLMYLGCGYGWVGALDTFHTLSYEGVGILPIASVNSSASFWVGTRLLETLMLLSAPYFLTHGLRRIQATVVFGLLAAAVLISVWSGNFPVCYIDGQGLTPFKIGIEYLIIGLLALAIFYLQHQRSHVDPQIRHLMIWSIALTMGAEILFTFYVNIFDLSLMAGHLFKLFSYWLIFIALVQTSLHEPFRILARSAHTYDAIPDPVLLVDLQGVIREANPAALAACGLPEHQLLEQHCHKLFHDPHITAEECPVCSTPIRTGSARLSIEIPSKKQWLDISLSPIRSSGGIEGRVQVIRDITTNKAAEQEIIRHRHQLQSLVEQRTEALEESRAMMANLLSNLPGAVYRCKNDTDWTMTFMSKGTHELTGYQPEEFLEQRVSYGNDVIHPQDQQRVWDEVQAGLTQDGQFQFNYRIRTIEGELKWVWEQGLGIYDEDGNLIALDGFITDISEQVRAEQALQVSSERLAATNRELEGFNYSVSHDLRSPLRAIDGFSHALLEEYDGKLDTQGVDYLRRIRNAAQRMGHLIDDLLQLSRVGRSALQTEPVDISVMVQDIMAQLRDQQPERPLSVDIEPGLEVYGDKGLLRIALMNLLENAWKYSTQCPQTDISFGHKQVDGKTVYFVRDHGVGFDMRYAHKLFGAFQRLHRPEDYEGTGIGLATVKRIILRHDGEVWAESEPGEGASFYFTLGRPTQDQEPEAKTAKETSTFLGGE